MVTPLISNFLFEGDGVAVVAFLFDFIRFSVHSLAFSCFKKGQNAFQVVPRDPLSGMLGLEKLSRLGTPCFP